MMSSGQVVVQRLHRLVRHGYRPWLGYDVASGGDRDIELRHRRETTRLAPDGTVTITPLRDGGDPRVIAADDEAGFDAAFPPDTANRRNLVRRLYEIGIGA